MNVDDYLNVFRILDSFSYQSGLSLETRLKNKENKKILQPILDYFNQEIQPMREEILEGVPVDMPEDKKTELLNLKINTPEMKERRKPILNVEVEASLLIYEPAELAKAIITESDLALLEKVGILTINSLTLPLAKVKENKPSVEVLSAI